MRLALFSVAPLSHDDLVGIAVRTMFVVLVIAWSLKRRKLVVAKVVTFVFLIMVALAIFVWTPFSSGIMVAAVYGVAQMLRNNSQDTPTPGHQSEAKK